MYRKDGKLGNCNCQMVTSANIDPDKISHLEGFDIHIVRGDYLPIKAPIYVNGLPYVFKEGEKLHSQCRIIIKTVSVSASPRALTAFF